jgi:hypothetical protein
MAKGRLLCWKPASRIWSGFPTVVNTVQKCVSIYTPVL